MSSKREAFIEWKNNFINNFEEVIQDDETTSQLITIYKEILETGAIRPQFGEDTEEFLSDFTIKLTEKLLNTDAKTFSDIKSLQGLLNTLVFLFIRLITSQYEDYLQKESLMFFNNDYTLYKSLISDDGTSYFYSLALKALATPVFITEIEIYIEKAQYVPVERFHFILKLVQLLVTNNVFNVYIDEFLTHAIPYILRKIDLIDEIQIESMGKYINDNQIFDLLISLTTNDHQKFEINNIRIGFNVRVSLNMSTFDISKAIASINNLLDTTPEENMEYTVGQISKTNFVLNIIPQISNDTIKEFMDLFLRLIKNGYPQHRAIKALWERTLPQNDSTGYNFFKSWRFLIRNEPKIAQDLFKVICGMGKYSRTTLKFLTTIANTAGEESKAEVFRQISDLYFESDGNSEMFIPLIICFLPSDEQFREKMQNKCLTFIRNGENVELAIPLMKASIVSMSSEKAHDAFEAVVLVEKADALPLLNVFLRYFANLSEEEFEKLKSLIDKLKEENMKEVCSFILEMTTNRNLLTSSMLTILLCDLCLCEKSTPDAKTIKTLYAMLQPDDRLKAINDIWGCLFRSGSEDISDFMVFLFGMTSSVRSITAFIEQCTSRMDTPGALVSLAKIIHFCEDGVDRAANQYMPINMFIADEDCYLIDLYGAYKGRIRVPKGLSYSALKNRICALTKIAEPSFSLIANERIVTPDNFDLDQYNSFEIKVWYFMPFSPPTPVVFPSQILYNEKYSNVLLEILSRCDPTLSPLALNVLNLLPTLESQNQVLRNFGTNPQQWASFFNIKAKYLCLYRMHFVGSIIQAGHEDWIEFFYASGGVKVLLGIAIFMSAKFFNEEEMLLLLRISRMVVRVPQFDRRSAEMNEDFGGNAMAALVQLCLDNMNNNEIIYNLMEILSKFSIDTIKSVPKFVELFNSTIFHSRLEVRRDIMSLIKQLKPAIQARLLMPLFKESVTAESDCFFELMIPIADVVDNAMPMWEPAAELLLELFKPPQTEDGLTKLNYKPASTNYAQKLFIILDKLSAKFKKVPDDQRLFVFLINDIVFNGIRYFQPSQELFSLVIKVLSTNPDFREPLINKLSLMQNVVSTIPKSFPEIPLRGNVSARGIYNLGNTSYLSAVFQQLYHIEMFRNQVLSVHDESWIKGLQLLFMLMKYIPASYVNPHMFTDAWVNDDLTHINTSHRGDASEFFRRIIRRFCDQYPSIGTLFRGQIRKHYRIGEERGFADRYFVTLPLDVNGMKNLNESLKSFILSGRMKINVDENEIMADEAFDRLLRLPKILTFSLKRFIKTSDGAKKVNSEYSFPLELVLSECLDKPLKTVEYDLVGVIAHNGHPKSGMYSSYVKDGDGWLYFNDCTVEKVTSDKMIADTSGGVEMLEFFNEQTRTIQAMPFEKSNNAVLLFYHKRHLSISESQIDADVIQDTLNYIQKMTFRAVTVSPQYTRLMLKVSDSDAVNGTFLYDNLITTISSQTVTDETARPLVERFSDMMRGVPTVADFVLSKHEDFMNILVKNQNKISRELYLDVIKAAIINASPKKREVFAEAIVTMIISQEDVITQNWRNTTEFFEAIMASINADFEGGSRFLDPILMYVREIIPRYSQLCPEENVIATIDMSPVFRLLGTIIETPDAELKKDKNKTLVFNREFIETWIKPRKHTLAFTQFLSSYISDSREYASMMSAIIKESGEKLTAMLGSAYIVLCLILADSVAPYVVEDLMKMIDPKAPKFKREILDEVKERMRGCYEVAQSGFLKLGSSLLKPFVTSKFDIVREGAVELVELIIPSLSKQTELSEGQKSDFEAMYIALLKMLPDVTTQFKKLKEQWQNRYISKDIFLRSICAVSYFRVAKRIVSRGGFNLAIIDVAQVYVDAMLVFSAEPLAPNPALQAAFDFLVMTVTKPEMFFANASLKDFLKALIDFRMNFDHPQLLGQLFMFIPESLTGQFFGSECFSRIMRDMMCLQSSRRSYPEVRNFINSRVNESNVDSLVRSLFSQEVVTAGFRTGSQDFYKLCWEILDRFPHTSSVFYSNKCHIGFYSSVSRLTLPITRPSLRVLAAFTSSYTETNLHSKTFFGKPKTEVLAEEYVKEAKVSMRALFGALARPFPDYFATTGVADFIRSLAKLSSKFREEAFDALQKIEMPVTKTTIQDNMRAVAAMVSEVCTLSVEKPDHAQNVLARELQYARGEAVEIICNAIVMIEAETGATANTAKAIDEVMRTAAEARIFSGSPRMVAVMSADDAGEDLVKEWTKHCVDVATSVVWKAVDGDDGARALFEAAIDCADALQAKYMFPLPKVGVPKEEINAKRASTESEELKAFIDKVLLYC